MLYSVELQSHPYCVERDANVGSFFISANISPGFPEKFIFAISYKTLQTRENTALEHW